MTTTASVRDPHLTTAEQAAFADEGFLVLRGLIDPADFTGVRAAFADAMERQACEWLAQGLITDVCAHLPFETRYGALRAQVPATFSNSWRRILVSPAIHAMWQHPALITVMRQLIGDELYAAKTWNGRPRAQGQPVQTIDWHQDAHYYPEYQPTDRVISVWMPLVPVDERSGCLQVAPRSHLAGMRPWIALERNGLIGLADHDVAAFQPLSVPMAVGDVLLFSDCTFHRSLDNRADYTRWSLDIRFYDAGNTDLQRREGAQEHHHGSGYQCFSASDPRKVASYDTWAATYDYEGEF